MYGRSVLRPGHDTSCPYKNRCELFNFTELRLDAIALLISPCLKPGVLRRFFDKRREAIT